MGPLVNETKIYAPRSKQIESLRAILGIAYIGLWLDEGGNYVLIVSCCPHSNQFLVRSGWVCSWLMGLLINRNTIPVFRCITLVKRNKRETNRSVLTEPRSFTLYAKFWLKCCMNESQNAFNTFLLLLNLMHYNSNTLHKKS